MKTKILDWLHWLLRELKFERARRRALARLKKGLQLSWTPPHSRSDLYKR
jgi:hypothetical protein